MKALHHGKDPSEVSRDLFTMTCWVKVTWSLLPHKEWLRPSCKIQCAFACNMGSPGEFGGSCRDTESSE